MSGIAFNFDEKQFNRLFPFYILINKDLSIQSIGKTLEKICPAKTNISINEYCFFKRPYTEKINFDIIREMNGGMVVLELLGNEEKINLRGQFEFIEKDELFLFVGTPWFGSMEQIRHFKLTLSDFAVHDPMIDLLHVLQTQEISNEDLKELLKKINKQKNELKEANREIHDIALFPMQNPDPLIRIDLEGNVLRLNPAAEKFISFEYNGIAYNSVNFWKQIVKDIQITQERYQFQANAGDQIFSFVCKYLEKEGYINIYGRNITVQRKIENEYQRLSLVASSNENGIIFTDAFGKITWSNEGFSKLTGFSKEEIIGKTPIGLGAGPLTSEDTLMEMVQLFETGKSFNLELIHYRKDGSYFWVRTKGQAIIENGTAKQYFSMIEDITHEKEQEEQLRILSSIAAENTNGVVIADKEGRVEWANKNFEKITGYTLEEMKGKKPGAFLQGKDTDRNKINYLKTQIAAGEPFNCEILNYHKSGRSYWLRIQGQALKNSKGEIIKFFAIEQDVTEEIETRKKIQEFENRFWVALEKIGDNVWEHDFRTGKTTFSKSENNFLGTATTDQTENNQLWWNSIYKEDLPLVAENDKKCRKGEIDFHVLEYRMVHKNGEIKWVLDRGVVIEKNLQGLPLKMVGTHTDITKIKETEKALRASESEYRSLAENIPGVLYKYAYHTNGEEEFTYVSPGADKKIGVSYEELQHFYDILSPEELDREHAISEEAKANKTPYHFEGRFNIPGKPEIWLSISSAYTHTTKQGSIIHSGIILNVTKEKEVEKALISKEEKYRGIIANMNLGLIEVDLEDRIQFVNHSFCEMSGFTESELINNLPADLFLNDTGEEIIKEKKRLREKNHSDAYELSVKKKSGENRWWLISGAPRYDETGKLIGSLGIHLDITDRKKLENQLLKASRIAADSVKAKEVFLANMSHEIRTPLNAIIGMSNQMTRTLLNEKQGFYLDTIHTAADNLLVIINDILDLSKIEAGKLSLEKIGFDPKDVLARAMMVLNHKAEEKGISFTNDFTDSSLSPVLIGDPYRMNQILLNLLGNAIKFTEIGGVDLSCKVINRSKNTQTILMQVKDTGIGMDEDFVAKLFEKFSQEYESVTRRFGGTGLGMSISKELIELMGGKITVESKKGEGTVISVEIEFETGSIADLPVKTDLPTDSNILKDKVILVADDNEMNRLVAKTVVENYGAISLEAANGKHVIDMLESGKNIDLILMDVQMPVMNGLDATRFIRDTLKNEIPVIALTANAIKGESSKCLEAGMNDYVAKPFKEEDLIGTVAKWLMKKQIVIPEPVSSKSTALNTSDALFDLSKLTEISRGNNNFIQKMISIFVEQMPVNIQDLKNAYEQKNLIAMAATAHKMKPSIDNMGIESLKNTIREIEKQGKANEYSKTLPDLINKIEKTLQSIVSTLKTEYRL